MKVKKFLAPTMPEVMNNVRKELGADAVILNSKVVHKGGFLGLFKKKNIEVIAALDPQPKKPIPKKPMEDERIKKDTFSRPRSSDNEHHKVLNEVRELRRWIEKNAVTQSPLYPNAIQQVYDLLLEQEIKSEIAKDMIDAISDNLIKHEQELSIADRKQALFNEMHNRLISSGSDFGGIDYDNKIIHLVGPTGVGKTTTIAKIAANCVLRDKKKVAFITMDTYRIAAIDQLKTYSKILDIPLEIAYSLEDYQQACKKFEEYDLILVDTAGRNFRNEKYIKELQELTDVQEKIDAYLVLSLTTRTADLEEIYQQFQHVPIKQFIFTKEDETSIYGSILNLCLTYNIGVAYITDGQDVPDDITETSVNKICKMIVGEHTDE